MLFWLIVNSSLHSKSLTLRLKTKTNQTPGPAQVQKTLLVIGLSIVVIGLVWPWLSQLPFGRLPGDLVIERENFRVYLPITTMILVSIVLTLVAWFFR